MNRLLATLLAVCLAATACANSRSGKFVEVSSPTPAPDKGTVEWRDCKDEAQDMLNSSISGAKVECGTVEVPLRWDDQGNPEKVSIALLRVRHNEQTDRIGSLLVNPGGPGASGRWLAAAAPSFLPKDVLTRFDIVGFDPRGVGESDPVHCLTDEQKDSATALDPDPVDDAGFEANVALAQTAVNGCINSKGANLSAFSTEQTARDMDAIRTAVGDEKLSYLGFSYGTLLGAVYAQLFPTNIRALVLDGAVNPMDNGIEASEGQAAGFEHAFDNLAANCAERGGACKIGPDARATVQRILAEVKAQPVEGDDDRVATDGVVMTAILSSLYNQRSWAVLEQALAEIDEGDPAKIFELSDGMTGREPDGKYDNSMDANTTVNCVDDATPPTTAEVRSMQEDWRNRYPLFGAPLALSLLNCAQWPADMHDPYETGPAAGAPPILVVGTTGDPATPYENTEKLANMLGTGVTLTWEGEGHTAYPQTKCVRTTVDDYLIDLVVPEPNTVCQ